MQCVSVVWTVIVVHSRCLRWVSQGLICTINNIVFKSFIRVKTLTLIKNNSNLYKILNTCFNVVGNYVSCCYKKDRFFTMPRVNGKTKPNKTMSVCLPKCLKCDPKNKMRYRVTQHSTHCSMSWLVCACVCLACLLWSRVTCWCIHLIPLCVFI